MADEQRVRRVQERIQQTVARLIGRRVKDPRLSMVTITDVRVTGDLQHASIFYTLLGDENEHEAAARAFVSASGLIRSEVGRALGIRLTPTLEFIPDTFPARAASIEKTLAATRERDAQIALSAEGSQYAAGENPYRDSDSDEIYEENTVTDGETLKDNLSVDENNLDKI